MERPQKKDEIGEPVERYIPPYNGYGSYEDSLGNCLSIIPKPPQTDFIKFLYYDKYVFYFEESFFLCFSSFHCVSILPRKGRASTAKF